TGKIADLNPERFRVTTRLATIGIRGSDVGSDLRDNKELHFCFQSHKRQIFAQYGNGPQIPFLPGQQIGFFPGMSQRHVRTTSIKPRDRRRFLQGLMGGSGGFVSPSGNTPLPKAKDSVPIVPTVPTVPQPDPPPQPEPEKKLPLLLASGTDWQLFRSEDPFEYFFKGNALDAASVSALIAETSTQLFIGSGPVFARVTHIGGNVNMSGSLNMTISMGSGIGYWECIVSASAPGGHSWTMEANDGYFEPATADMLAGALPVTFELIVNGQTYYISDISSSFLRGRLYGPGGTAPPLPNPTGVGININYNMLDGTKVKGAGGADLVKIEM
ncbi:MAG: hypothetical protein JXN60_04425, partial [Lentisphaerae bacterium]|nr:hypothetical protein [Lentisphaerota bacterium]